MLKVEVIGNLGADAVIKQGNGNKFVSFRVAHSEKWTDQQGHEQAQTTWIDCVINDCESKVIPYLKQGVKVFVRGNASLRVYSSPKDRMMKAGLQVSVREVELCGGQSEEVPRSLVDPATAVVYNTAKHYRLVDFKHKLKKDEYLPMVDAKGGEYIANYQGFVIPKPQQQEAPQPTEEQEA